ncbi:MAG: adenylate kinase [Polyangiaceae bacterium]
MGRRVLIKGTSGSGKSTLAARLAQRLGVPHVELDALHHGPNWQAASPSALSRAVRDVLDDERGWVVDGNYDGKLGSLLLDRAELVVWLDLPLKLTLLRLVRRTSRRWLKREVLWNGNRETLGGAFWGRNALFAWAMRSYFRHRREWPTRFAGRPLVRLRSVQEVEAWFAAFCAASAQVPVSAKSGETAKP